MAVEKIPADTIICGRPWSHWVSLATRTLGRIPTGTEVKEIIQKSEINRAYAQNLIRQSLDLDQLEQIGLEELEFMRWLRKKRPHLHKKYAAELKNTEGWY